MSSDKTFQALMTYDKCHDVCTALLDSDISDFEKENSVVLPQELRCLYRHFDGGEIFIPGTTIFGLANSNKRKTIKEVNSKLSRSRFDIPSTYIIFAKLNFGDLICVNLNAPFDVIQWDHESNEKYCVWSSISEWIDETIKEYIDYEEGAN